MSTTIERSLSRVSNGAHDISAFKSYLDKLLQELGTTEVIERMLVEELVGAHHNIGRLHVQAALSKQPEEQRVLNCAAARLMGEFRRSALALKSYRTVFAPNNQPLSTAVSNGQHVAASTVTVDLEPPTTK